MSPCLDAKPTIASKASIYPIVVHWTTWASFSKKSTPWTCWSPQTQKKAFFLTSLSGYIWVESPRWIHYIGSHWTINYILGTHLLQCLNFLDCSLAVFIGKRTFHNFPTFWIIYLRAFHLGFEDQRMNPIDYEFLSHSLYPQQFAANEIKQDRLLSSKSYTVGESSLSLIAFNIWSDYSICCLSCWKYFIILQAIAHV